MFLSYLYLYISQLHQNKLISTLSSDSGVEVLSFLCTLCNSLTPFRNPDAVEKYALIAFILEPTNQRFVGLVGCALYFIWISSQRVTRNKRHVHERFNFVLHFVCVNTSSLT